MTQAAAPPSAQAAHADDMRDVLLWHAGWAAMVALEAIVLSLAASPAPVVMLALMFGAIPALGALLQPTRRAGAPRLLLLCLWCLAMAFSAALAGGVTGPLAAWCLMPLAAAVMLGGTRQLAQGAALSVLSLALTALAQALGLTAISLSGGPAFAFSLFGAASALIALAMGLLLDRRRLGRRIEREVTDKEALEAILEGQPHLVLWLDQAGQVTATFGHAPAGLDLARLKTEGLTCLAGPTQAADVQLLLTEASEHRRGALTFPLAGADAVWLSLELCGFAGSGAVGVLRDVTVEHEHARDLERARQDAEQLNVSKSRFLANMSHELRTPLNAIMGFSDIMRARLFGALPGKYSEYADLIHDAGSHLLDLINDVLDMSKIEASRYELRLEQMDAREPVSAALRLMRLQADDLGVKLRGMLPGEPLEAQADRRALKQIVLNLVSNALKFTPRGGLVSVALGAVDGALELTVIDTGVGIAKADLSRLGRPFEQAGDPRQQSRGTGLGLSLVRAFAELHEGEMVIESQLGEGTAVTVRLPVLTGAGARTLITPAQERDPALLEPMGAGPSGGRSGGAQVIPFKPQR